MKLHREGFKIIAITTTSIVGTNFACWISEQISQWLKIGVLSVTSIFWILVLLFFRIPKRQTTQGENLIICPADGKVVVIEEVEESEFLNKKMRQISIFMSPLNVHVNRYPIDGEVSYSKYHSGKYLIAWHPKSSTENERTAVVIKGNKTEVLMRQIAGTIARRIICYAKKGKQAKQNEEMGFIKFGSRVDVLIPLSAEVKVNIGDVVKGSVNVLAELK